MASFYKRGDYQWEAKIRKAGFPQLARTFESKSDAMAWAAEVETEMRRGTFVSRALAERKTLAALIGQYVEEVSPLHRGADSEIARLKAMARRKIAETAMANLRAIDIARYRDERLKVDGVCPATVVREMGLLQRVIAHAMQEWEIALPRNPAQGVARPKVKNARDRRLKPARKGKAHLSEEARLLAACTADGRERSCRVPWLRPIVELAIATAMRRGEILALDWQHVHLEERYVHLPETKNGESRDVPLSTQAVAILAALKGDDEPEGRVFDVSANAFKLAWARAVKRAKLEDFHFHDLRHEGTSRIAEKLSNVLELSSVTGHKDLQMLKRYYHPRPGDIAAKLG